MAYYEVDFTYKIEEYGSVDVDARDVEEAEQMAVDYVKEAYPDVNNITIDSIKEIIR